MMLGLCQFFLYFKSFIIYTLVPTCLLYFYYYSSIYNLNLVQFKYYLLPDFIVLIIMFAYICLIFLFKVYHYHITTIRMQSSFVLIASCKNCMKCCHELSQKQYKNHGSEHQIYTKNQLSTKINGYVNSVVSQLHISKKIGLIKEYFKDLHHKLQQMEQKKIKQVHNLKYKIAFSIDPTLTPQKVNLQCRYAQNIIYQRLTQISCDSVDYMLTNLSKFNQLNKNGTQVNHKMLNDWLVESNEQVSKLLNNMQKKYNLQLQKIDGQLKQQQKLKMEKIQMEKLQKSLKNQNETKQIPSMRNEVIKIQANNLMPQKVIQKSTNPKKIVITPIRQTQRNMQFAVQIKISQIITVIQHKPLKILFIGRDESGKCNFVVCKNQYIVQKNEVIIQRCKVSYFKNKKQIVCQHENTISLVQQVNEKINRPTVRQPNERQRRQQHRRDQKVDEEDHSNNTRRLDKNQNNHHDNKRMQQIQIHRDRGNRNDERTDRRDQRRAGRRYEIDNINTQQNQKEAKQAQYQHQNRREKRDNIDRREDRRDRRDNRDDRDGRDRTDRRGDRRGDEIDNVKVQKNEKNKNYIEEKDRDRRDNRDDRDGGDRREYRGNRHNIRNDRRVDRRDNRQIGNRDKIRDTCQGQQKRQIKHHKYRFQQQQNYCKVQQILPDSQGISMEVKILKIICQTASGLNCVIGDQTAVVNAQLPSTYDFIMVGKSIKIINCLSAIKQQHIVIVMGQNGKVKRSLLNFDIINIKKNMSQQSWVQSSQSKQLLFFKHYFILST